MILPRCLIVPEPAMGNYGYYQTGILRSPLNVGF